ncbi:MAG: cytochrome C biogenesis protein ResC [Micrococcales bacterium]|nr:MAG: cytochrome C biogenesis protein ResC [Micrococcales bacterium]PIE25916.1 MAG: cytochrome C biogenesis protein ResC [Micrococcales bacterium]
MDIGSRLADVIGDGSLLLSVPVAVLAGLVSFASPCVLPLVPGFLGYVTGLGGLPDDGHGRRRTVAGAALFVAGFSAVFVTAGFLAGSLGALLTGNATLLTRVLGLVVVAMGLMFLGVLPGKDADVRTRWRPAAGLAGAPLLGAVFGLGWVPCIGPVLAAVFALGINEAGADRGAVLATCYCLGLGLPFLAIALGLGGDSQQGWLGGLRRHRVAVARFGGGLLLIVGLLLVSGLWSRVIDAMRAPISGVGTWI